ncbi:MAG: glutamine amidotransferase [Ilumatobacteraceae bacterium]
MLLVLATEWFLARRRRGVGRRQWRTAAATRIAIAGLLLAAVFAPVIKRPASRLATVFLSDASDSMGTAGTNAAFDWVREALTHRAPDDVAGVVVFGAEARLEQLVQTSSSLGTKHVVVDASATNLEAAMRLGAALVPDDARKRVVLVSDGRSNTGDPELEAGELGELGVPVDVHVIEPRVGADAAVQRIEVPRVVRSGDSVAITASVLSTTGGPATVVLERDGDEVGRRAVELTAGTNEVVFQDVIGADAGGTARYTAFVDAPGDVQGQNDTAYAGVPIEGPASVLVVEGTPDEGATLAGALRASGLAVQTVVATALPDVRELAAYSSIVLVDVDARDLSGEQLQSLETAVRDLGRGLVTVGGERSYGLGGYRGTPLEDLLPVISEITDPMRRTKVAEVLSFDVSGSMANCHCDEGENRNARIAGGVMKTDISKAAAARTVEALSSEDELGILAWNAGAKWIVDLQQLPSAEVVDSGLRTLKPAGNTDLTDSLTDAADALRASDASLKHIILFSDGFTAVEVIEKVADQAGQLYEQDGITVSVVATGEGAAPSLEDIAIQGHGRFYPGRDLQRVPQVIAEEAVIASRNFINEGTFLPEITSRTPITERLDSSPELLGYVATTAKGTATTALRIGPDRDPLLVSWQAGLGRVSSWTSDASAGWSQRWANWDGYVGFWSNVVTDTFQAGSSTGAVQATLDGGRLQISVEGAASLPDGATATARVAGPDGQRIEVQLERVDGTTFTGELPVSRDGAYAVGAVVEAGGETVLSSSAIANRSYPVEYQPGPADEELLRRISTRSGGRGAVEPAAVFDRAGLRAGTRRFDLRGPLLLLAALLFPIAVALSRLSLRGASVQGAATGLRAAAKSAARKVPSILPADPDNAPTPARSPDRPRRGPVSPAPPPAGTVGDLLAKKRAREQGPDEAAADE